MDATYKAGADYSNINTFEPLSDFVQEGDCDTLLVYLPGFVKEHLRVQLARSGVLKISGTRPLGDKKWSSFHKDFPVSPNCDTSKITAKFEEGTLYVRQPKLITPTRKEDKTPPVEESSVATKTSNNNQEKTVGHKITQSRKEDKTPPVEESPSPTKTSNTNQEKSAGHKITPSVDNKVVKTTKDEQKNSESAKKLDERIPSALDKSAATSGKLGKSDSELANKVDGAHKLLDVKRQLAARQKMTMILVALFAFALGMCIKNLEAWF